MDGELLADQPLGEKLIKKGSLAYLFMFLIAPVGYFIRVIISNTLSVEDVGLFYSILGFVTLISMYNDLGLTEALQYFIPKYRIEKKYNHYKTIIYLTLGVQVISGIIIAGVMWLGADRLAIHHFHSPFAKDILRLFCWYFIGINFLQVLSSIYISFQDVIANNIVDGAKLYATLTFTIIFWLTGTLTIGTFAWGRMLGLGMGILVSMIIFFVKYKKTLKKGILIRDRALLKKQFHYAFWVFLGTNVLALFNQVDQQIVINFLGAKQAGYYANFFSLIMMYAIVIGPIFGILFPIVNELISKNEIQKLGILQNIFYKYFSVLALSISGIFVALGPQLATIFFGSKFAYSGELLVYIAPFFIIYILFSINFLILAGLGKVRERVKILLWALLANIAGNIFFMLILKIGLVGAVISLIFGWVVLGWLSFRGVNHHMKIDFDWKFVGKNVLIVAILTCSTYIVGNRILINENVMRYQNIGYLLAILIGYYGVLGGLNRGNIKLLMKEVKEVKTIKKT